MLAHVLNVIPLEPEQQLMCEKAVLDRTATKPPPVLLAPPAVGIEEVFNVEEIKFACKRKREHYYRLGFEGYGAEDRNLLFSERELVKEFGFDKALLALAKKRGAGARKWTKVCGDSSQAAAAVARESMASDSVRTNGETQPIATPLPMSSTEIPTPFTAVNAHCIVHSFGNVIGESARPLVDQLMALLPPKHGFIDFTEANRQLKANPWALQKNFPCEHTHEWLVAQTEGMFLLCDNSHAVSVDCARRLIFDNGRPFALPLSIDNLRACGILTIKPDSIRKVARRW